jgi:O-antigen/teichoic acid export membrane protein
MLIGALLTPISVAYYGVSSKIPDSLPKLFQSVEAVFLPNMSELIGQGNLVQAMRVLDHSLRITSFVTASLAVAVTLFQKEIVRLLFSEKYMESAPTLSLLMIALNMELILYILGNTLVACGQSDKPLKCNFITTIVSLAGNLTLIPLFGFFGAAIARILSRYAASPMNVWYLHRANIKVDITSFLKPIILLGTFWIIYQIFPESTLFVRFSLMIGFMAAAICWRIISIQDLSAIVRGLRP